MARLFSFSGFTSSLYYFLCSRDFDREHRSVLLGKIKFEKRLKSYGASNGLLRRNIHRLEKGLIMKQRRPVFALDYIEETIDLYSLAVSSLKHAGTSNNEVSWAHDVLVQYFDACSRSVLSAPARKRFEELPRPLASREIEALSKTARVPYVAAERETASVSFDAFFDLAKRRRSVRWFQDKPVEPEKLDKIIDAARLSPSACNRLPYHFLAITDGPRAQACARLAGGTGEFASQIPALVVVLGDLSCYSEERDRHLIYIDASLASMSLMLAAETVGLSTCPINWSDVPFREKAMYKFLQDVPEYWRPIMLIAVGYADDSGAIPFSSKKDMSIIRSHGNASL
ncbi:MAG: nitroreductase family protein [Parvibaculaceae bacterium]|nr:nitroreductase family protein [Parvibaculaceae bacterium]